MLSSRGEIDGGRIWRVRIGSSSRVASKTTSKTKITWGQEQMLMRIRFRRGWGWIIMSHLWSILINSWRYRRIIRRIIRIKSNKIEEALCRVDKCLWARRRRCRRWVIRAKMIRRGRSRSSSTTPSSPSTPNNTHPSNSQTKKSSSLARMSWPHPEILSYQMRGLYSTTKSTTSHAAKAIQNWFQDNLWS